MSNLKNRLTQLEKQLIPHQEITREYPAGHYERTLQTLTSALIDLCGEGVTAHEFLEMVCKE